MCIIHFFANFDFDNQFAFFLIPLAISLAAEYLLPTAAVYMSEYTGGALAASFVMGMASGYSDTVSTVFDGGTYSLGEADLSSFVCSRTGMIVGAAIAALPTSRGAKLTTTAGNMALSHVSGTVVTQGEKALARQVTNYAKTSATQKTTQVAEKYFVNGKVVEVAKKGGRNRFVPDTNATGAHSAFRKDPLTGKITHYETFRPQTNFRNPNPWESAKRFEDQLLILRDISIKFYKNISQNHMFTTHFFQEVSDLQWFGKFHIRESAK